MSELNVSVTINAESWEGVIAKMKSMLEKNPKAISHNTATKIIEKAVADMPVKIEKAVEEVADAPKEVIKETTYSVQDLRKIAREAAQDEARGKAFVKAQLDAIGANSVSNVPVEKYEEFINLLNQTL